MLILLGNEGKNRNYACALYRESQGTLMLCAGTGNPARKNFAALGRKTAETVRILIVDLEFLRAEFAHFFLEVNLSLTSTATVVAVATGKSVALTFNAASIGTPAIGIIIHTFIGHNKLLRMGYRP
jgi:hypothetical protein